MDSRTMEKKVGFQSILQLLWYGKCFGLIRFNLLCFEFSWSHHYAAASASVPVSSHVYANCAIGPPQVSFLFQSWAFHWFACCVLVSVMVFAFCFQVLMWPPCSSVGAQPLGFVTPQPLALGYTLGRHMCLLVMECFQCRECTEWLLLPLPWVRGLNATHLAVPK